MLTKYKYILDAAGDPVPCDDLLTWGRWFETADRQLAESKDEGADPDGVRVSTVFLALDLNYGVGAPVLWETMVFGGPLNGEMERYTSKAAAVAGHQRMCERVAVAVRGANRPTP